MTDVLVSTAWVAERLDAPGLRIIEVSSEPALYAAAHLPGAVAIDWKRELIERKDESSGLVPGPERFAALAGRLGLRPQDEVVFYGDKGGRHAARALWMFEYYRHPGRLHLMDGGREKWRREGRPWTAQAPVVEPTSYPAPTKPNESLRASWQEIAARLADDALRAERSAERSRRSPQGEALAVCDVRTRAEHEGTDLRAARGGHLPGAVHIEWGEALAPDGSFRSKEELATLYGRLQREQTIVTHCQLGIRSAHTWFVLRHLLGYPNVKNYDGSWQEWGNLPDVPIER